MDFRRLLVATTGLTALTMLVGVYTAEFGAGLACEARWPLCDGAVFGLFPANIPSFIEWFHRLLAMITGFFILGSALAAWRRDADRLIRYGLVVAVVVLPFQIVLGALTVTRYEILILTAHFATPMLILGGVVAATVWSYRESLGTAHRLRTSLIGALVGFPILLALTPRLFIGYSWAAQMTYYTVGLSVAAILFTTALLAERVGSADRAIVVASVVGALLVVVNLVVGRLHFGDAGQFAMVGLTITAALVALVTLRRFDRSLSGSVRTALHGN